MFKKGIAAAGCLAVVAAGWSYAATTWQLQTKLSNVGGKLQVRDKAFQTTAGSIAYSNFTTSALIPVKVYANPGYKISSVKKGTVAQTITDDQLFTINVDKTGGLSQSVVASFTANKYTINGAVVGSGSISPASASVSYGGTVVFSTSPTSGNQVLTGVSPAGLPMVDTDGHPVTLPFAGAVKVTLANVQAAQTVTATYTTVSVSAGSDKVVAPGAATTIYGSVSAGDTISWSLVSGPEAVDTSAWTTATPSFTPAVAGTYVFKATEGLAGLTDLVEITATGDVTAYMQSACDGCHNATTGVYPSTAFNKWTASPHVAAQVTCISCHTDGAMPTPVNTQTVNPANFQVLNSSAGTVGTNYCAKCHSYIEIVAHDSTAKNDCAACHTFENHSLVRTAIAGNVTAKHVSGKAVPASGAVNVGDSITEYVTNGATCVDCHNSTNSVIAGFAAGGHGHISDDPLNAFAHYDWSGRTNNGTRQNGNCNRCHSAGGFVKFTGQDAALATRLAPVAGAPSGVLVCVSCHSNIETGALRTDATPAGNPTTLAGGYFALFSTSGTAVPVGKTKIQVQFPGYKNSSICIPCHSGRSTDDVFVAVIDRAKADLKNYTTIQTSYYQHAANMGQTFIGKGAFNFNGGEYVGANGHAAVKNGETDTQGPCVGCHYSKDGADHSLEPVGYSAVCQSCHAAPFGATDVEEKKAEFDAGVAVLDALIREKFDGLRTTTSPLETERANVRFGRFGKAAGVAATDATAKAAYGAWYNWQILAAYDKAAFAHNPNFARTVLMDTIDYLDGNGASLNGSAAATIAASTAVTPELAAAAAEYIETPACASCHATQTTLVQGGKHAAEVSTHSGSCGRCHTTEGYVAFLATNQNPAGTYSTQFNGSQNVSCSACHDQHGTVRNVAWAPQPKDTLAAASAEYKLCTSCHNLTDASGNVMASGLLVSDTQTVAKQQHYKDWYRNIASTHYDLTTTGVGQASTVIEGYNVRYNSATACSDCHGHEFYTNTNKALEAPSATDAAKGVGTIQTDWAQSGHAGGLLKAKFTTFTTANPSRSRTNTNAAAVMAVGVTGTTGPAWEHYDWDATSRQACQKCHTATGVSNFLNAVAAKNAAGDQTAAVAYSAASNDFSHLAQWATAAASPQNEMLYCWGCHSSAETGALRVTGNMTLDYKTNAADTTNAVINVPGKAAVCVSCHTGRGNAASLFGTATIDPTAVLTGTSTPKNSATATSTHYLNAAATIFKNESKVGYEFPGLNYANPVYYQHSTIGCNDCHMPAKSHKFEVVEKDAAGVITSIKATNCASCHTGAYEMTAAKLEEEAEGYKQAMAAFSDALVAQGYTWTSSYPYFLFTGPNAALKWRTQGDLGAGHNYNYLVHEPGAYAHNRYYTKRLIYDSIDWLDNNVLDGSVVIDGVKYPEAAIWLGAARP